MKITRVYTGEDGLSHFGEVDFPLDISLPDTSILGKIPAHLAIIRETPPGFVSEWHVQGKRALIIQIEGQAECEVGHGKKMIFREGEVVLYEDKTGKGH